MKSSGPEDSEPQRNCSRCDRLEAFRVQNRSTFPSWHNAPVSSFGPANAPLLIVGLAPGLKGANRTGRPFTGDYAGDLLYATLLELDLARGNYGAEAGDGLELLGCRITNAVRCVPPENKPTTTEISACRSFLTSTIRSMLNLRAIVALGRIAHDSTLVALGAKRSANPFGHGRVHHLGDDLKLFDSYHCSRYNTNTGVLTPAMFRTVVRAAKNAVA